MRLFVLSTLLTLWSVVAQAFEIEAYEEFGSQAAPQKLTVISTLDIDLFTPVIEAFLQTRPDLSVAYTVASSAMVAEAVQSGAPFDVVISSAMDLQTKLVNDGYAQTHLSSVVAQLPDWAMWHDQLFAFTQEAATILLSKAYFEDGPVPQTRQELIRVMRENAEDFEGKLITYDLRRSGLGYLFATQDARSSESYWRLTEVMGQAKARLVCCSSDMIEAVATGEALIAYNVLHSYAAAHERREDVIIMRPRDFETVMLRTAFIAKTAQNPDAAGAFVDMLVARALSDRPILGVSFAQEDVITADAVPANRIRLGPGLLAFLDDFQRSKFLRAWEAAILQ